MKRSETVEGYLHRIRSRLHLDPRTEGRVVGELASYFEEKTAELEKEEGLDPEEAERAAIRCLGPAPDLARLLYAAHSRGSWLEVLLACQPHLLFAALCATHLWRHPALSVGLYLVTLFISLLGWRRSRPTWIFSWVGYAFAPLLAGGLFFHGVVVDAAGGLFMRSGAGEGFSLGMVAILALLCAAGLWLFLVTAARALHRDWLLLSVLTLPWPILVLWLLHLEPGAATEAGAVLADAAALPPLLLLTVTSALFLRLRRRLCKAAVLAFGSVTAALVMTIGVEGQSSFGLLFWVSLLVLALHFSPALLPSARRGPVAAAPGTGGGRLLGQPEGFRSEPEAHRGRRQGG